MMENNNIVVAIHSKQNQAGNQHQIQIQNEAELTRMLLDILAKPTTKDIESLNPLTPKKYRDVFTKLGEMSADEKAKLYPQIAKSKAISVLYHMQTIQQILEEDELLKKKHQKQLDEARWLVRNGASNACIRETCTRVSELEIKKIRYDTGCPVKVGRNRALPEEVKLDVINFWKAVVKVELIQYNRLRQLQEAFPNYDLSMLYPATLEK